MKKFLLYLIRSGNYVKIGYTSNIYNRLATLNVGNPVELELLLLLKFDSKSQVLEIEDDLHFTYNSRGQRKRGEWYYLSDKDIQEIYKQYQSRVDYTMGISKIILQTAEE
jgi:hypothetical protein